LAHIISLPLFALIGFERGLVQSVGSVQLHVSAPLV
jgi:hypothetical protein